MFTTIADKIHATTEIIEYHPVDPFTAIGTVKIGLILHEMIKEGITIVGSREGIHQHPVLIALILMTVIEYLTQGSTYIHTIRHHGLHQFHTCHEVMSLCIGFL